MNRNNNMNTMRALIIFWLTALTIPGIVWASESNHSVNKPVSSVDQAAVHRVMNQYKQALQNLSIDGTFELFSDDSSIFEQGGVEGTYRHYVEHHLGPELEHFVSFKYSDYEVQVTVLGQYALATETYLYEIRLKQDEDGNQRVIDKKGVSTAVLVKSKEGWKILRMHSSSRKR